MSVVKIADACRFHEKSILKISNFQFESGQTLSHLDVAYETWGRLNESQDNAIFVCHALTGDTHAGSSSDGSPGWWSELIKPGGLLDINRFYVVCANVIGGCSGTSGPSSFDDGSKPFGLRFPQVTIRDMVTSQILLTKWLGIQRVRYVIGGSLGGMQSWEWACMARDFVDNIVVIAADASFSPLGIGYNAAMRQAITCDPNWQNGDYYKTGRQPTAGLGAARTIGMLTYRTGELFWDKFARDKVNNQNQLSSTHEVFTRPIYEVESYLYHAGDKLSSRFDANSYLYLTRAMDSHDIGRNRGGVESALHHVAARLVVVGITGDYLYVPNDLQRTITLAKSIGIRASYMQMASDYGHDAFLADQTQLHHLLSQVIY